MILNRILLVSALTASLSAARAAAPPKPPTAAATEARNEVPMPSFSGQVREAQRITGFLVDALVLNNVQLHAIGAYTVAEHQALALAVTAADIAEAQQQYLLAMRRVLAASQQEAYMTLCRQLAGTMLPIDGNELAAR